MTLAETQSLFHDAVTRAEGDRSQQLERCFTGTAELPAVERVEIYADMYLWRLVDALREDYPKLAALLGDEAFFALAERYVREHPSRHPDLGQLGRHLPAFFREHPDAGRPDLTDLASLEWARSEVFFEAELQPERKDALAGLAPEEFLDARLQLVPALRVVIVEHDAAGLWRALEHGEAAPRPAPAIQAIAVWRQGFEVFHTTLDLDEATALEAAASGDPLSRVCAAFAGRQDAATAAFGAIVGWFDEGWIAGCDAAPKWFRGPV